MAEGGQGIVYEAEEQHPRRRVALKLLLWGPFAPREARERFRRGIGLAASVKHPNVVAIHGRGVTSDGCPYYAMEWVDGEDLATYRAKPVQREVPELLRLFLGICDAIAAIHARGILHRDLKPANVMVDRSGRPRVLDFGLAKPAEPAAGDDASEITVDPVILGTPEWAAPEQLDLRGFWLVDRRTDIYALGRILQFLLTGGATLGAEDGSLDPVLRAIVRRAVAVDPADRYPAVEELARDCRRFLGDPAA